MATPLPNLYNLFENLRSHVECLKEGIEPQFIQMALNFEQCRCRWLKVEAELGMSKEVLAKAEAERGALEVKLKHARNQVDVEIRRRQKAEADYEKLDRQILLIRDLLVTDSSSCSIQLNEEQRNALAFLSVRTQPAASNHNISHRLSTIDESTSILSDISYDKTEDSLDWDSSVVRTVRLRKRQKRRSSRTHVDGPPDAGKRVRSTGRVSDRGNESIVARTTLTVPANGGPIEAVSTIEALPHLSRNKRRTAPKVWSTDTDTDTLSEYASEALSEPVTMPFTPKSTRGAKEHVLTSKTVIRPETCLPCGKRIKFGKLSLRCRDCRLVAHVECRDHCTLPCCPTQGNTSTRTKEDSLVDYISDSSPMVPLLVVHCIREIERRGLHETGLYRVSGADRTVRELKEKFLRGKNIPSLSQVDDIHAVTGLLKYFLRNLRQPLLTFRLNRAFMQAAEIPDDDNSVAAIYQTISDLPPPNRDTLAFLVLHLQRVSQNADTKMDVFNLARVFGPTIVGHAVPEPDHMTMLQDTQRQPKVVERLLGLPAGYWQQFVPDQDDLQQTTAPDRNCFDTPNHKVSILGPVTTPEHQLSKTPSSSSLTQRVMSSLSKNTPIFGGSKSKAGVCVSRPNNFFSSPMLK